MKGTERAAWNPLFCAGCENQTAEDKQKHCPVSPMFNSQNSETF